MQPLTIRKTPEARSFSLIKTILCFCFAPAFPSRHRGTHFRDGGRAESFRLFSTHTLKGKAPERAGNLVLLGGIWYKTRRDAAFHRSVLARRDPSSDLSQRGRSGCRHLGKVGKIGFLACFIFRRFFFFVSFFFLCGSICLPRGVLQVFLPFFVPESHSARRIVRVFHVSEKIFRKKQLPTETEKTL